MSQKNASPFTSEQNVVILQHLQEIKDDFSEHIEKMKGEIEGLKEDKEEMKREIEGLKRDKEEMKREMQGEIESLKLKVLQLEEAQASNSQGSVEEGDEEEEEKHSNSSRGSGYQHQRNFGPPQEQQPPQQQPQRTWTAQFCKYGQSCNMVEFCMHDHHLNKGQAPKICNFDSGPRGCTNQRCNFAHPSRFDQSKVNTNGNRQSHFQHQGQRQHRQDQRQYRPRDQGFGGKWGNRD